MRALDMAASVPWAIRPETLQLILDIAARVHEPNFELAASRLAARQEEIDLGAVSVTPGKPLEGTKSVRMRGNTAVLPVTGPIFRYGNLFSAMSGATTVEGMARDLRVALNDPEVESILLHVDSPGGEVNGTGEFADMVYAARARKPVWAYVSYEGASAAYWIASACDRIICAPTAVIGSIGVVAAVPNPNAEGNKDKIQFVSSQSPHKRPDPTTDIGKAKLQTFVDDIAAEFIATVARNRGVDTETVLDKYGAGDVMVGQKAVDAGLADSIGSYEQALIDIARHTHNPSSATATRIDIQTDTVTKPEGNTTATKTASSVSANNHSNKTKKGIRRMPNFRDRVSAWLSGAEDPELEGDLEPSAESGAPTVTTILPLPVAPAAPTTSMTTAELENRQLRERLSRMEDENRRIKVSRIQEKAEAFWGTLFAARKVVPAEESGIIANYVRAATDDEVLPLTDGSTRVSMLESREMSRPSNMLLAEQLPDALNDVILMRNRLQTTGDLSGRTPEGKAMSDERRKDLLSKTDLGRTVLNGKPHTN